jgi:16S rRNA (cytosine967-C5)-methyltransferase
VLLTARDDRELSREDRALAQEIVLGVIRWQRALDYFVERYSGRSIERLDLPVLIALRIGLYQLRFLDRIPRSAAVNESVNLVKRARASSAAGLVNAVLRKAATHLREEAGKDTADPLERASIALSHPQWMLERWEEMLGDDETRKLALANNSPQVPAFRVNTLRATSDEVLVNLNAQGVTARASLIAPGAFVIETGPAGVVNEAARGGLIYVQDEGSQLVSILLEPRPGDRVLDLCAAPGSKSSHIAMLAQDKAWVVACDIHPHRLNTLRASCYRLGIDSVNALALDATQALPFDSSERFDRVLVDAPCSGTGTLRENPEIKWRLAPDDVTRLAELQRRLLECAASWVATGGRLVYSTCSIEPEENEEVIRKFLERGALFRVLEPKVCADVITAEGFVRTFPHRHGTDGFFAAVLERTA